MHRLLRDAEQRLRLILARTAPHVPVLTGVDVDFRQGGDVIVRCDFADRQPFSWMVSRREMEEFWGERLDFIVEVRSLWSGLAEDRYVDAEVRVIEDELRYMRACGAPSHWIADKQREIARARERVRWHRAQQLTPAYFVGVDGGAGDATSIVQIDRDRMVSTIQTTPHPQPPRGSRGAEDKGLKLLREWLTPEQRAQYDRDRYFDVVGSDTGTRYRVHQGRQQNIHELHADGSSKQGWCFLPEGQLVEGDCMLAQKIALETMERWR